MKKIKKNIAFTGILFLSISALFAGEKSIKLGSGYKVYNLTSHDFHIHSGRYFYGGYSHEFGKQAKQKFQFQIANSNRELELDVPYISASTSIDVSYEINFKAFGTKKSKHYFGVYTENSFQLNFFPKIDKKNLIWQNQSSVGISSLNSCNLKKKELI